MGALLDEISAEFSQRHQDIRKRFLERFEQIRELLYAAEEISEDRRLLIGSYFLAEYSLESAALFNPSIVPDPDQTGLPPGALRFILSLRATGEGHISSITFRTGIIHPDQRIEVLPPTGFLTEPHQIPNPDTTRRCSAGNFLSWDWTANSPAGSCTDSASRSRWKSFAPASRPSSSGCRMA